MKLLLYCTKAKPQMYRIWNGVYELVTDCETQSHCDFYGSLNGKIVGECDYEVEKIESRYIEHEYNELKEICKKSCLSVFALMNYARKDKFCFELSFYAIHIKNLVIYDTPRELKEYYNNEEKIKYINSVWENYGLPDYDEYEEIQIKNAPQNMMYAFDGCGSPFVLISIRPQWLCKILNGEKTIEVRKKVLKEMM